MINTANNTGWRLGYRSETKFSFVCAQILFFCMLVSCNDENAIADKSHMNGFDYRLFQGTPAWELAKAVRDDDEKSINAILSNTPKLVNYQEEKYGETLLMMAVLNRQMKSAKALLANKADVNIHTTDDGGTVMILACHYTQGTDFADILLQNGANVNDVEVGPRRRGNTTRFTPLIAAARKGNVDLVDLLIKKGANINYQNEYKQSALSEAAMTSQYRVVYLLLQNGADYSLPMRYDEDLKKNRYLADVMRFDMPSIGSEEHKYKMKIVDFLKQKGIDYRSKPIPKFIIKRAMEEYPNTWKEYLDQY